MWVKRPTKEEAFITSKYGPRTHPVTGEVESFHKGIDLGTPVKTEVYAPFEGNITSHINSGGLTKGFGRYCILEGVTDQKTAIRIIFAHLCEVCRVGKTKEGQLIAMTGNTGRSTGPHLHLQLEIFKSGKWCHINPELSINLKDK